MQKFKDYISHIYGMDALSCCLVLLSVILNLGTSLLLEHGIERARIWNLISFIPLILCIFRCLSLNHDRRWLENEWFIRRLDPILATKERADQGTLRSDDVNPRDPILTNRQRTEGNRMAPEEPDKIDPARAKNQRIERNEARQEGAAPATPAPNTEIIDRKAFRFFKCPACRQKIRVPRGKGKIEITCPRCSARFIKKT